MAVATENTSNLGYANKCGKFINPADKNVDMDVFEAIKNRRSIRKYLDIPIEWEKVGNVLEAGRLAPSSGNLQAWKFIVVRDPKKKKLLAEAASQQYWMEQAPVLIVIVGVYNKTQRFYGDRGKDIYIIQDCAMAAMQMMIAAQAQGLGTCFVSALNEERVGSIILMRGGARPMGIISIGYAAEKPVMPLRFRLENIAYLERDAGIAYVDGFASGRIADFASSMSDWRVAERGIEYVQGAVRDIDKVTKEKRNALMNQIVDGMKSAVKKPETDKKEQKD
jgi:nitroreductase